MVLPRLTVESSRQIDDMTPPLNDAIDRSSAQYAIVPNNTQRPINLRLTVPAFNRQIPLPSQYTAAATNRSRDMLYNQLQTDSSPTAGATQQTRVPTSVRCAMSITPQYMMASKSKITDDNKEDPPTQGDAKVEIWIRWKRKQKTIRYLLLMSQELGLIFDDFRRDCKCEHLVFILSKHGFKKYRCPLIDEDTLQGLVDDMVMSKCDGTRIVQVIACRQLNSQLK